MTRYIEPTLRTRQLWFLAALLVATSFWLLTTRIDQLLPPLDKDLAVAFDQILERSLIAAILSTVFFVVYSLVAIHYTRRVIASQQWPPTGMTVPFRTKVKEIKNPRNAWLYLTVSLGILFAIQIALPWAHYVNQREHFRALKEIIRGLSTDAQPAVPADSAASRHLRR